MYFNEDSFRSYLTDTIKVKQTTLPYMLSWVKKYLSLHSQSNFDKYTVLDEFCDELANSVNTWQVNQARFAVQCYWQFSERSRNESGAEPVDISLPALSKVQREYNKAIKEFERALRLSNRSYNTERSYIGWLKRFLVFLQSRG